MFEPFEERLPKGLTASVITADLRKRLAGITAAEIRISEPAPRCAAWATPAASA